MIISKKNMKSVWTHAMMWYIWKQDFPHKFASLSPLVHSDTNANIWLIATETEICASL